MEIKEIQERYKFSIFDRNCRVWIKVKVTPVMKKLFTKDYEKFSVLYDEIKYQLEFPTNSELIVDMQMSDMVDVVETLGPLYVSEIMKIEVRSISTYIKTTAARVVEAIARAEIAEFIRRLEIFANAHELTPKMLVDDSLYPGIEDIKGEKVKPGWKFTMKVDGEKATVFRFRYNGYDIKQVLHFIRREQV